MQDIRLKTETFEFEGKEYVLRCNMNVLADVQEWFGGEILNALQRKTTLKSCIAFLAAMLNDYADEMGWEERFTPKQVGRKLVPTQLNSLQGVIFPLVSSALSGDEEADGETDEKNAEATRRETEA